MFRDTWRNIKYVQLVHGIKRNDSCSRQFSFRGCESTSINILYTIFPPAARLCSPPTAARLNDSTPIMCFTCHYLWRWASARWWKSPRYRYEVRAAPACGRPPDWHRLLWRSKVDVTVALGQVNEGTVLSGAIFHIRPDYKLGYVGHSTPVFNHTQHHISAHMRTVWTVWLNVSRGEDAVLPLYVTPVDWGLSKGTMPQRTVLRDQWFVSSEQSGILFYTNPQLRLYNSKMFDTERNGCFTAEWMLITCLTIIGDINNLNNEHLMIQMVSRCLIETQSKKGTVAAIT